MNIIKHKNWYFALSLLIIVPGVISLFLWGLNLSIDFTGGSTRDLMFKNPVNQKVVSEIKSTTKVDRIKLLGISVSGNFVKLKTSPLDTNSHNNLTRDLQKNVGNFTESQYSTIGPVIGSEITTKAFEAIVLASVLIILYIAWSFRSVPKPTSSWRFGVCAIIALLHDALVLLGIFSILGHFFSVEVDSLFVTAVLTVIGFSVHDTIVVFDRIRENLRRLPGVEFAEVVNSSILQTFNRSLNTSLTVILVLFTLFLFGGDNTRWFVIALLIGIISGTYSSIFNASPLLVLWNEWDLKRK